MNEPQYLPMPRPIVVYALIAINVVVFFCWYVALLPNGSDPLLIFLVENFLVSWAHLQHGHYWVLLTSVFSHEMLLHLAINMFVLWSFGSVLEVLMGKARFLFFYLIAGAFSGIAHAATSYLILGHPPEQAALGASGAVAGLLLLFALTFPKHKILLFGIVPIPALLGALAFIGIDVWGFIAQMDGGGLPIGHGAHLGGALVGILYYFFWWRPRVLLRP